MGSGGCSGTPPIEWNAWSNGGGGRHEVDPGDPPRGSEAVFASGLLLLYAMVLFLSPDPEWTIWAAQMAVGVLYIPDSPTLQGIAQGETVRVLSAAGAWGSLSLAALLALGIKTS